MELSRCPIYVPTPEMNDDESVRERRQGDDGRKYEMVIRR
jgi:hypothetical protein